MITPLSLLCLLGTTIYTQGVPVRLSPKTDRAAPNEGGVFVAVSAEDEADVQGSCQTNCRPPDCAPHRLRSCLACTSIHSSCKFDWDANDQAHICKKKKLQRKAIISATGECNEDAQFGRFAAQDLYRAELITGQMLSDVHHPLFSTFEKWDTLCMNDDEVKWHRLVIEYKAALRATPDMTPLHRRGRAKFVWHSVGNGARVNFGQKGKDSIRAALEQPETDATWTNLNQALAVFDCVSSASTANLGLQSSDNLVQTFRATFLPDILSNGKVTDFCDRNNLAHFSNPVILNGIVDAVLDTIA